jgi:hypothetical protein
MQLTIDTPNDAAARPGADRRTTVVPASQLMAAGLCLEGHRPARLYAGHGPGQRKGNAMSTRSPYPDVEVPEICLPRFVVDRAGERGAAVPLMGPADPGTATPLMLPR